MELGRVIAQRGGRTVYLSGERAVKVFEDTASKADVLNEALGQALAEETALRVPGVLEVLKVSGRWAIVSEYIPGETLEAMMERDEDRRDEYLERFVDLQLKVHAQYIPRLTQLKDRMRRMIRETDLDAAVKYDLQARLDSAPSHSKVCHGDLDPSNIIVTPGGEEYILDWSQAAQGNASADVARTYLHFCLKGEDERAEKYLDLFCQRTGTLKRYVYSWLPVTAACLTLRCAPGERELLMRRIGEASRGKGPGRPSGRGM